MVTWLARECRSFYRYASKFSNGLNFVGVTRD
jgi:hypothetical protein